MNKIKGIYAASLSVINRDLSLNIEKTVNLFLKGSIILAVQHSVDNTVFAENTVIYSQFP